MFSSLMFSIDCLSLVACFYIIISVLRLSDKWKKAYDSKAGDNRLEKRINTALFSITIFLWIRLLSYPLFYVALQTFVKHVEGAMCIYGVTRLLPGLCNFLEIIKPLVFFIIGLWLIFHSLTRKNTSNSLVLKKLIFLIGVCVCIMTNSLCDSIFFIKANFHTTVTCCTVNTDLPDRISATLSRHLFGRQYEQSLLYFYYFGNLGLIGTALYFVHKYAKLKTLIHRKKTTGLVFMLSLINLFLTALATKEIIGPRLMKLPYHHCIYCLMQYVPESCFIISLFILGTFGFGWAFGLEIVTTDNEVAKKVPGYTDKLYRFSILCLSLSLAMVSIHFL